jgi:hypothetical protein
MYKCINNSAPDYLCNLFDMNTNSLGYMTKTLNQIIFFSFHQNQNIFFSNIGNQNIFLTITPPPPSSEMVRPLWPFVILNKISFKQLVICVQTYCLILLNTKELKNRVHKFTQNKQANKQNLRLSWILTTLIFHI